MDGRARIVQNVFRAIRSANRSAGVSPCDRRRVRARLTLLIAFASCRSDVVKSVDSDSPLPAPMSGIVATAGSGSTLPHLVQHGGLSFEIVDDATGQRMPGKLTIVGVKGTRDPKLSKGDIGTEDDTSLSAYNRVFSLGGAGVLPVPTGTYDVTFSRGIEWTISTQRVTLTTAGAELHGRLRHVIDTPRWVSADFHVHAASSPDSRVPMREST